MPIYLVLLGVFLVFVSLKLRAVRSYGIMRMSLWLIVSYTFLIITNVFSGIEYRGGNILRIFPYFVFCLLLVLLGDQIGVFIKKKPSKTISINIKTLSAISIFGAMVLVFDVLRLNNVMLGFRISDYNISIIGVIGNIFSGFGLIVWLYGIYLFFRYEKKIPFYSYLGLLSYISGGIVSAGRQSIILSVISTFILILWCVKNKREKSPDHKIKNPQKAKPWGLSLLVLFLLTYFLFISTVRSGIFNTDNKINMMGDFFNAKISDKTLDVIYKVDPFSDIYIEALFYYSHELKRLDLLYQYYDYFPLFGLNQMSYLERRVQWLFGNQNEISWSKVEFAIEQKGNFSSHTWGTFITNYIIDFGRFGTLIACFLTGLVYGMLYTNLRNHETKEKIIRHALLLAGVVFSIQFSPLAQINWFFPVIAISYMKIISNDEILTVN